MKKIIPIIKHYDKKPKFVENQIRKQKSILNFIFQLTFLQNQNKLNLIINSNINHHNEKLNMNPFFKSNRNKLI